MRYLKTFFEATEYSVFDTNGWKKFLPKKLMVVTHDGKWVLERPDENYEMGHATNIIGLMNALQISYYQNTVEEEGGDVTADGEPDQLAFDITIVKNNDGTKANPDTLKLDVDITYGDNMVVEFTIEKPSKVTVVHYTGIGSLHNTEAFFGFDDDSLRSLVDFFNSWGYSLTVSDFSFIDEYSDTYKPNI